MISDRMRLTLFIVFVALFVLIGLGSLGAALGFIPNVEPKFKTGGAIVITLEIAGAVVAIFKAVFPTAVLISVNVTFGRRTTPPTLDDNKCQYILRDSNGKVVKSGTPQLSYGPGPGVLCRFPLLGDPSVTAKLMLVDLYGSEWIVNSFTPSVWTRDATRVSRQVGAPDAVAAAPEHDAVPETTATGPAVEAQPRATATDAGGDRSGSETPP